MIDKCEICGEIKELVENYMFCNECEKYLIEEYEIQKKEDLESGY